MHLCPHGRDWLTLSFLPGFGCALIDRLVEAFDSPGAVLGAGRNAEKVAGIGPKVGQVLANRQLVHHARSQAELTIERLQSLAISLTCRDDFHYPSLLNSIQDPPVVLYYRGNLSCLQRPTVAIIGSRAATSYGKQISYNLARELAGNGVTVISGGAYGIDTQAHKGVLACDGATVSVQGCGLDVIYPRGNAALYQDISERGAVVSEYPPGTKPDGFRFPARNRIISGLALGVIVVEATLKSGSLITARLALDQGRDVFAVPGRIDSAKSAGPHRLLQQGAVLVHTVQDILDELDLIAEVPSGEKGGSPASSGPDLTQDEKRLLEALDVYPLDIDTIMRSSGLAISRVHDLLLTLELKGCVRQLPGQQYERVVLV